MQLLITGPQGSGKGTQAQLLAEKYNLVHLDMGNILRSVAGSDNKYAQIVRDSVTSGTLVPDEYVRLIAWDHVSQSHQNGRGMVIEGYPRSLPQYEHLEDMLRKFGEKLNRVILIKISEEESIRRLADRLTCNKCGRVYNVKSAPPDVPGICECGGQLVVREDDKPEAIKKRLEIYWSQTTAIVERARAEGILLEVDGERSIEVIFDEICKNLN